MFVIDGDKFAYFDCDDTLVMWDYDYQSKPNLHVSLTEDSGTKVTLCKNPIAIAELIDRYDQGYKIVVWSQSGAKWASEVVWQLGLSEYVHLCISKPHKLYDDLPIIQIFDQRIDMQKPYYDKFPKEIK